MVNTIFIFMVFGAMLGATGASSFFIDIATALTGNSPGGPAKIATISSMLFGSVSGSAVANTVATGSFTIPMMKKVGYKAEFAGGVEAVASTGGQMMPPIMGAGAFVMSEITGIPYSKIVTVSFIPAFLFYLAIYTAVHFQALKRGLRGLPHEEIPKARDVMRKQGHFIIPLIMLIVLLLVFKFSVEMSAACSILILIIIGTIKNKNNRWEFILEGLRDGAQTAVTVSMATAAAGIMVGVFGLTGIGLKFSNALFSLASGNTLYGIILIFLIGLVLGMGLPVIAAFIIMVSVAGPGLMGLGLPMLTAYLITFWYSQTSNITPPVCVAAYAAAGIAKASTFKTGLNACRIGFPIFIIPVIMAYRPLLLNGPVTDVVITIASVTIGIVLLTSFFIGYWNRCFDAIDYVLTLISGSFLLHPNILLNAVGLAISIIFILRQRKLRDDNKSKIVLN